MCEPGDSLSLYFGLITRPTSCRRLSLTPLCYLWQRDQGELLSEMIEAGMEAILIKVAGIGLTTKHLGRTLADMQPTLTKLVSSPLPFKTR
jgi:diphthamide synthase (EF-2-diphthine--ammonia ligase)